MGALTGRGYASFEILGSSTYDAVPTLLSWNGHSSAGLFMS